MILSITIDALTCVVSAFGAWDLAAHGNLLWLALAGVSIIGGIRTIIGLLMHFGYISYEEPVEDDEEEDDEEYEDEDEDDEGLGADEGDLGGTLGGMYGFGSIGGF